MVVVSDTGPLLHLFEIGALEVLNTFQHVVVPRLVALECDRYGVNLNAVSHLVSVESGVFELGPALRPLAAGDVLQAAEAQAIAMALAKNAEAVLTDDAAAREAVTMVGLTPIGSLGIIIRACKANNLSVEAGIELLDELAKSTLYLRQSVLTIAKQTLMNLNAGDL